MPFPLLFRLTRPLLKHWPSLAIIFTALLPFMSRAAAEVSFTASEIASHDSGSNSIVAGDFNNDGILDLVTVNPSTISFYKGLGNGKYAAPVNTSGGGTGLAAAADFNRDGKLDLAVASFYSGTVIWLGNGDGTFTQGTSMSQGESITTSLTLADFNGDHIADVAMNVCPAASPDCSVQVYLGKGDGTFELSATLNDGGHSIVSGDFNADGYQDIAITQSAGSGLVGLVLYLGEGNGQFRDPITLNVPAEDSTQALAVGDFYNDRIQAIAFYSVPYDQKTGTYSAYVQTAKYSNGRLTASTPKAVITNSKQFLSLNLAAGDVNGDFKDDLVIAGNYNNTQAYLDKGFTEYMRGTGEGTFDSPVTIPGYGNVKQSPFIRDLILNSRHDIGIDWQNYARTNSPDAGGALVLINTNATTNCTPPPANALAVHICSPTERETLGATVTFRAAGNAFNGVAKRMELWIDGKKLGQNLEDQLYLKVSLSPGTYTAHLVVVDTFDRYAYKAVTFMVK